MSVHITIAVVAGADLRSEPFASDDAGLLRASELAAERGYLDGGLDIVSGDIHLSWLDVWDHVDGLLVAWLEGLRALRDGAESTTAVFPDTRVECELARAGDNQVHIEYEDVDAVVPMQELQEALTAAALRLLDFAAERDLVTPALATLSEHIDGASKP